MNTEHLFSVGVGAEAPAPFPGASFQIPWNQEAWSEGVVSQSAFPAPGSEPADVTLRAHLYFLRGAGVVSEAVMMGCPPAVLVRVKNFTGQSEGCRCRRLADSAAALPGSSHLLPGSQPCGHTAPVAPAQWPPQCELLLSATVCKARDWARPLPQPSTSAHALGQLLGRQAVCQRWQPSRDNFFIFKPIRVSLVWLWTWAFTGGSPLSLSLRPALALDPVPSSGLLVWISPIRLLLKHKFRPLMGLTLELPGALQLGVMSQPSPGGHWCFFLAHLSGVGLAGYPGWTPTCPLPYPPAPEASLSPRPISQSWVLSLLTPQSISISSKDAFFSC